MSDLAQSISQVEARLEARKQLLCAETRQLKTALTEKLYAPKTLALVLVGGGLLGYFTARPKVNTRVRATATSAKSGLITKYGSMFGLSWQKIALSAVSYLFPLAGVFLKSALGRYVR